MLEYKLSESEGRMLHEVIGKILNKFEIPFKELDAYVGALWSYNLIEANKFTKLEFRNKDEVEKLMKGFNFCLGYTDMVCIDELVDVDELMTRILIDLYDRL